MKIGFIGTGYMGNPMARNLLKAGHELTVYDIAKSAAQNLLDKGAKWANTPKAMAKSCPVVITMLPGPPEVEETVYGANGLMAGWKQGDIYIDMSTSSPSTIRRVANDAKPKGVSVLDAPVSGGVDGAEAGTLAVMVGGDSSTFEKVRGDILENIGDKINYMGDIGCGSIAKICNNLITLTVSNINYEAFVLGVKAGIDPKKLREAVLGSSGSNRSLELWPRNVFRGNFEPGFKLKLALKDCRLALSLGREYNVPMPIAATVEQRLLDAVAAGLGEKGSPSTLLRLEELTGVKIRVPDL